MKNIELNNSEYRDLIESMLKKYSLEHTEEETYDFVISILRQENMEIECLNYIEKDKLAIELGNIILERIKKSNYNNPKTLDLLPIIINNNILENNKNCRTKLKLSNKTIKRISLMGIILVLSLTGLKIKEQKNSNAESDNKYINNLEFSYESIENSIKSNYKVIKDKYKFISHKIRKDSKKYISFFQEKQLAMKKKILYDFKKYDSIKSILKRQVELENLGLTDEDKIYKDCNLSAPKQWFIYELSVMNKKPVDLTFSIIHTETRGKFNSSKTESHNGTDSSDLGLTQQNTKSGLKLFCNKYNLDYNDKKEYKYAYDLVKDNDYVNLVSCFLEYDEIATRVEEYNPEEYAGYYNGWVLWKNKKISRQYVEIFSNAYNNVYTKHHNIEEKEKYKRIKKSNVKILKKKITSNS